MMMQGLRSPRTTHYLAILNNCRKLELFCTARPWTSLQSPRQFSLSSHPRTPLLRSSNQCCGLRNNLDSRIQVRYFATPRSYDPNSPRENQTMTLHDGRKLGFAEYGSPTGAPIFYFHGDVGSRMEVVEWDEIAKKGDMRIIGVDRPGMGLSTFQPDRKLLDWPKDVRELARHLEIPEYRVIGASGGGPYVLACAFAIPQTELKAAGVVAGMGKWSYGLRGMRIVPRITWNVISWMPELYEKLLGRLIVPAAQDPNPSAMEKHVAKAIKQFRESDQKFYNDDPFLAKVLRDVIRTGLNQGSKGLVHDVSIMTADWGFELKDISLDKVLFWYGLDDENTVPRVGRLMHKEIAQSKLTEYENTSHFTILGKHGEEILMELVKA